MLRETRFYRCTTATLGCVLFSAAFALIAGAAAGSLARRADAAPATTRRAPEPPVGATLATPTAPLSVTYKRSFVVTAAIIGDPGNAASTTVECLRKHGALWAVEATARAAVHATATPAPFVSARVSLPAAGTWKIRAVCVTGTPAATASVSPTSTPIRVSSRADHIVWNRDGRLTRPEAMAYRSNAVQMIIATANSLRSHTGTVSVYQYRAGDWVKLYSSPCRFGRNALRDGTKRHRGDGTTPTGIWRMPSYVFGMHRSPPSGTKMPFRHITKNTWWSAEKGSTYNTWITTTRHVDGERLAAAPTCYEYGLSTGYNAKPNTSVYGRGTGIFLHVWLGRYTAGCVSVPRSVMRRVFRTLDPNVRRVFAVGTTAKSGATSIRAY